jgi:hypothetical protein
MLPTVVVRFVLERVWGSLGGREFEEGLSMMRKTLMAAAILGFALAGYGIGFVAAQEAAEHAGHQAPAGGDAAKPYVPAYHAEAPTGDLPATIDPATFPEALNQNVYKLASNPKLKKILYQQPCYCGCDKNNGHTSLLDCYVDHHASVCDVCRKEGVYSYQEMKKGKSAAQIRQGIMAGKWKDVDLTPYKAAPAGQ